MRCHRASSFAVVPISAPQLAGLSWHSIDWLTLLRFPLTFVCSSTFRGQQLASLLRLLLVELTLVNWLSLLLRLCRLLQSTHLLLGRIQLSVIAIMTEGRCGRDKLRLISMWSLGGAGVAVCGPMRQQV